MDSADVNKARSSRRLLFWIVIGVIALNIVLFLKFGLTKRASRGSDTPANSLGRTGETNGGSKP